ncbi:MAG: hypothetical protein IK034_04740, partial [Bacilli bacterium]|nr:hypothetical protein [Bacilli bacterium]
MWGLKSDDARPIDIVIDRIVLKEDNRSRIAEALELAIKEGEGICTVLFQPPKSSDDAAAA